MSKPKTIVSAKSLSNKAIDMFTEVAENTAKTAEKLVNKSAHNMGIEPLASANPVVNNPLVKNIAQDFKAASRQVQEVAADKMKCLLKTCDCCNHNIDELNKLNQQNLKQNIEDVTQLGYAMLKCRSMHDFINLQQQMFELNLNNSLNNYMSSINFMQNMFKHNLHPAK